MLTPEQLLSEQKARVEELSALAQKAFEGVEKLVDLNMQVARANLGDAAQTTQAAMGVKDAQELLALQQAMLQPLAEKTAAYSRQLYDIASATFADLNKVAETQAAKAQKQFTAAMQNATKNAPAGTENFTQLMQASIDAASNAYESVQKAAKQASDIAQANIQAMSTQASAAAAPRKAKR
jgi:phasin family protein